MLEAALPVVDKPVEAMNLPELMNDNARLALLRLREIISLPISGELDDVKRDRLIGDMALGSAKLAVHVAEAEFAGRRADKLGELLERIAAIKD